MTWRYHYPQRRVPVRRAGRRERRPRPSRARSTSWSTPGSSTTTATGWSPSTTPRPRPTTCCMRITVENAGPEAATLHVLPTLWFRNTWAWGLPDRTGPPHRRPRAATLVAEHAELGRHGRWPATATPDAAVLRQRDQRRAAVRRRRAPRRTRRTASTTTSSHGADDGQPRAGTAPRPRCGYRLTVPAGGTGAVLRLRLSAGASVADGRPRQRRSTTSWPRARREADEFYAALTPAGATRRRGRWCCARRSPGCCGASSSTTTTSSRWLDGDPASRRRRPSRRGRPQRDWRHLNNHDVISMPDPWEYPWFAAWDLAFHCVALAHVDPAFAKDQLLLLLREWYMHPNGQLPAYEWAFGDVNPPVHAWAALRVFEIDGGTRLRRSWRAVFHKLLINFTWWVNRKDSRGQQRLRGRLPRPGQHRPDRPLGAAAGRRACSSRPTAPRGWRCTASTCSRSRSRSPRHDRAYEDVATKFFEHFAYIADADERPGACGTRTTASSTTCSPPPTARRLPLRVRSMVGLLPLCATTTLGTEDPASGCRDFAARCAGSSTNRPERAERRRSAPTCATAPKGRLLSIVGTDRLRRILAAMLDEEEFLSPHGLRSLSRRHRDRPVRARPRRDARSPSTTSPASRRPACSAATRTGAGRCGSRSTTWSSRRCAAIARVLRRRPHRRAPDRDRAASITLARDRRRPRPPAGRDLPRRRRRAPPGVRRATSCSRPTRAGTTTCRSTSTSTATPARPRRIAPDRVDRPRRRPAAAPGMTVAPDGHTS